MATAIHQDGSSITISFGSVADLAAHVAKLSAMLSSQISHGSGFMNQGVALVRPDATPAPAALRYSVDLEG